MEQIIIELLDVKIFILILTTIVFIVFIIKSYRYYSYPSYLNLHQFHRLYCQRADDKEKCPFIPIDMFHRCENTHQYHTKSDLDCVSIYEYIQDFLCQNNEYINRSGPVCPFVPVAFKQKTIYFFISNDEYTNKTRFIQMIERCKNDFLCKLQPVNATKSKLVYKCLLILIRSLNIPHNLIDEIQTELKPTFIIQHGLMFGEFHQSSNSNAIRNENFYPFRTRTPLLVIRYMVANDLIFLNQKQKYSVEVRLQMINKYLNLYHSGLLYRSKVEHLQSAHDILAELNFSVKESIVPITDIHLN
ncbi:unnamed protein product [Adineta ricciae]|uniref:DUF6875 domain-containing protein n=1 Tax=Adineta ricciae TaxID=249248 RepID=A0A815IYZ7_ADIRI|nr:unnamed protein product [Adineta ricciae]CAF1553867.1 unnamed protein product [Adineta ricciae]